MTTADFFQYVKDGGAYCAPLLLAALLWLNSERIRLLGELKTATDKIEAKSDKLESLAERTVVILTEFKGLMTGRKEAA